MRDIVKNFLENFLKENTNWKEIISGQFSHQHKWPFLFCLVKKGLKLKFSLGDVRSGSEREKDEEEKAERKR